MDEEDFGEQEGGEDLMDGEAVDPNAARSVTRDRISLSVVFEVKVIQLTLGKINANNKIEGIQVYNRGTVLDFESPNLKVSQRFRMRTRIREWGVNLITVNRKTNKFEECESVI